MCGQHAAGVVALGICAFFCRRIGDNALEERNKYCHQVCTSEPIAGLLLPLLSGVSKLRTSGAEAHAFKTWAKQYSQARRLQYMAGSIQNAVQTFNGIFPILSSMVMFFAMVKFTGGDTGASLTTGQFIAFTAAYGAFLGAMVALSDASLSLLRSVPIYERLRPIVETPAEVGGDKDSPGELTGAIDVSHVHFRYLILPHFNGHSAKRVFGFKRIGAQIAQTRM